MVPGDLSDVCVPWAVRCPPGALTSEHMCEAGRNEVVGGARACIPGPDITWVCPLRPCLPSPGLRAVSGILWLSQFHKKGGHTASVRTGLHPSCRQNPSPSHCPPSSHLTVWITQPPFLDVFWGDPASSPHPSVFISWTSCCPTHSLGLARRACLGGEIFTIFSGDSTSHEIPGSWPPSRNHTPRAPSHLRLPCPHTCSPALSVLFWLTPQLHLNPPSSACLRAFELADWADSYSSFLPQLRCHLLVRRNRRAKSLHFSSCFFVSLHPST